MNAKMVINSLQVIKDKQGFSALSELDRITVNKFGQTFSDEIWEEHHFEYDLPSKFRISKVLYFNNDLLGYCIGSKKGNVFYIHRFVVALPQIHPHTSHRLLQAFLKDCDADVYLMVNTTNQAAHNFYKNHGFQIIQNPNELPSDIIYNKDVVTFANVCQIDKSYYLIKPWNKNHYSKILL